MEDLLSAHPRVDAVFAANNAIAIGCALAANQAQRNNIFIVSAGWTPEIIPYLKDSNSLIAATAGEDPDSMAKKAVDIGVDIIAGKTVVQSPILIPAKLIEKENG